MSYARRLIDRFGGVSELAREIGRPVSTVQHWVECGEIRDRHKPAIYAAAQRRGIFLTADDFVDLEAPR